MSGIEVMRLDPNVERRVVHSTTRMRIEPIEPKPHWNDPRNQHKHGVTVGPEGVEQMRQWAIAYAKERRERGIPPRGPSILDEEAPGAC